LVEVSAVRSGAVEINGDGTDPQHHSEVTGGDAGFITGAATHVSARGGGFRDHEAVVGDDGDSMEVLTRHSGAVQINGDGAGPPYHSGVTKGAAGFTTGGVTPGLERGGGLSRHEIVVGIDRSSASSSGHGADRPPLPCYSNK